MNGEHPTGFWWCSSAQTKMKRRFLRAHAVPQGLCENLINAVKLLANQQKDGDSPIQNIIMGLKETRKERSTNGLRSFIASVNYSAVEVCHARIGQRRFKVVRPKVNGDCSVVLREGAGDLTLRAEDFDTLKACINVDHIVNFLGGAPLGSEGSEWEELYHHCRDVSEAAGATKKKQVRVRKRCGLRQPKTGRMNCII